MAKNYNLKEFHSEFVADKNTKNAMIADCGRRFPLASNLVSTIIGSVASEAGKAAIEEFFNACPDWFTMRKLESSLKVGIGEVTEEGNEVSPEEAPKAKKSKKEAKVEEPVEEETEEAEAEEEEKPKKRSRKSKEEKPAKKSRKSKKVEEPEDEEEASEEDEDEWEI